MSSSYLIMTLFKVHWNGGYSYRIELIKTQYYISRTVSNVLYINDQSYFHRKFSHNITILFQSEFRGQPPVENVVLCRSCGRSWLDEQVDQLQGNSWKNI